MQYNIPRKLLVFEINVFELLEVNSADNDENT